MCFGERSGVAGAGAFSMGEPVLAKGVILFPFQEIVAIVDCFCDKLFELAGRERPVVDVIRIAIEGADRAGVEIDLAVFEAKAEAGLTIFALVDSVGAEHKEMDAKREVFEANKKVLPPALELYYFIAFYFREIHRLEVARSFQNLFTAERLHCLL